MRTSHSSGDHRGGGEHAERAKARGSYGIGTRDRSFRFAVLFSCCCWRFRPLLGSFFGEVQKKNGGAAEFRVISSFEASPAYIREAGVVEVLDNDQGVTGGPLSGRMIFPKRNGSEEDEEDDEVAISDRSSSSIGLPDNSDDDEEDEASSKDARKGFGSLGSLASLEDSLPVKRGLSNHFSGKSKSFTNLAEAITTTSAKDIEKIEHPFNKKRRILRWSKNMMLPTTLSMPALPVSEEDDVPRRDCDLLDDDEGDRDRVDGEKKLPTPRSVFKSYSCFALTDLREEEEEEEQD